MSRRDGNALIQTLEIDAASRTGGCWHCSAPAERPDPPLGNDGPDLPQRTVPRSVMTDTSPIKVTPGSPGRFSQIRPCQGHKNTGHKRQDRDNYP
jgi:hypothetical protein